VLIRSFDEDHEARLKASIVWGLGAYPRMEQNVKKEKGKGEKGTWEVGWSSLVI
jgi:hypothetical protein